MVDRFDVNIGLDLLELDFESMSRIIISDIEVVLVNLRVLKMFRFCRKWLSESRPVVLIIKMSSKESQPTFWFHCGLWF